MSTVLDFLFHKFQTVHFTGQVQFWILLGDEPVFVAVAHLHDTLVKFFTDLRKNAEAAPHIPAKLGSSSCTFYRLKNPVSLIQNGGDSDEFLNQVKKACSEKSNREHVNPIFTDVRSIAHDFFDRHIYLVIEFPDSKYPSCELFVFCVTQRVAFSAIVESNKAIIEM